MPKIWGRVDPPGKKVLKQLDDSQRNARERGQEGLPKHKTKKIVDRVVKPTRMDKKGKS